MNELKTTNLKLDNGMIAANVVTKVERIMIDFRRGMARINLSTRLEGGVADTAPVASHHVELEIDDNFVSAATSAAFAKLRADDERFADATED